MVLAAFAFLGVFLKGADLIVADILPQFGALQDQGGQGIGIGGAGLCGHSFQTGDAGTG